MSRAWTWKLDALAAELETLVSDRAAVIMCTRFEPETTFATFRVLLRNGPRFAQDDFVVDLVPLNLRTKHDIARAAQALRSRIEQLIETMQARAIAE